MDLKTAVGVINRRKYLKYIMGGGLATAAFMSGVGIKEKETIIGKLPTFIIGNKVAAAGIADFTCDGFNDNVQVQDALDLLPSAVGGKIQMLAGNYVFAANVSRAINNVTIEGLGRSTYIAWDGASALFDLGATDYWHFKNLRLDAGGINFGTATNYILENVWIGTRFYEYYSSAFSVDEHTYSSMQIKRTGEYFYNAPTRNRSQTVITANRLFLYPLYIERDITIDRLAIDVTTADAGKIARLGIYNNGVNCYPGTLLLDAGTISVAAIGIIAAIVNQPLTKGLYWIALVSDGVPWMAYSYNTQSVLGALETSFNHTNDLKSYWFINGAGTGALADPFPAGSPQGSGIIFIVCHRLLTLD